MSRYDYEKSQELAAEGYPYYAIIMAAMRLSDNDNEELLRSAWPQIWDELYKRYNAPGGVIPGDPDYTDK